MRREDYTVPATDRLLARVEYDTNGGCWLYPTASESQRGHFSAEPGQSDRAYRAAYRLFVGPIPRRMVVCHKCDVAACVRPDHLFLGTRADNTRDMWAKGRAWVQRDPARAQALARIAAAMVRDRARGSRCGRSRLNEEQVRAIFGLKGLVASYRAAHLFGVRKYSVEMIWAGKSWAHLSLVSAP